MKIFSSKRRWTAAAALVLLALFLVRPGASRLKSRIIASLSAAVGRPVDLGSVHIRLLPQPGFDLENLVVYDDPAFGSEPILRASAVTADLRLRSLLRGRLEVSKLDLTEPSLNLVHHGGGGWNLQSLLERAARTPLAPTGKMKSEPRPSFPYIEGTSGRINFKNGQEKKPYALTNADFSLWQESEDTWGVRLKALPFRSDMNLNDTGQLQLSGTWQRAGTFRDTPVQFDVEWARAQLGQITKFFAGNDWGWRGDIRFNATVTGTPVLLKISSTVSADDFRRYDIASGASLRMAGRCDGEYSTQEHEFHQIACIAPVGAGLLAITGDTGVPGRHKHHLTVTAQDLPASAIGALARRAKKDLPEDLLLGGMLQGKLTVSENAATGVESRVEGHGEIAGLRLSSISEKVELGPVTVPIILTGQTASIAKDPLRTQSLRRAQFELGPFALDRARAGGAAVRGWVDRSGYGFTILGDAEVGRTLRLARTFGIRTLNSAADGTAQLNLQITGSWMGQGGTAAFAGPQVTGSAKLRNVRFGLRGSGEPVEISSAEMQLAPSVVRVGKLNLKAAGAVWKGSVEMPRGCGIPENCQVHFQLNTDEISLNEVNEWVNPSPKSRPWYRLGTARPAPSLLARVRASGRVTSDRFVLRGVMASKLSANVNLDAGKLEVTSVDADLLGGKHRGEWRADFGVKPAVCRGSGSLTGISLENISRLMKDDWVEGSAGASYEIQGPCAADFWQSSEGTLQVAVADGSLPHVLFRESAEMLKIRKFTAQARLHAGTIEVSEGELDSPEGNYEVSGTATLKREIDFKMARVPSGSGVSSYTITGTLAEPHVARVNGTEQARLKP
ncbi:MAG TPA: AsmA family protein [Candidatus Sulfotelmatobacter sp.]|nr:AsmA family protein [Candidatus Sulfotelmatobacter sp.]